MRCDDIMPRSTSPPYVFIALVESKTLLKESTFVLALFLLLIRRNVLSPTAYIQKDNVIGFFFCIDSEI